MKTEEIKTAKAAHDGRVLNMDGQPWEEKDRQELLRILTHPALLKAIAIQRTRITSGLHQLSGVDFTQEGSVALASRLQGNIAGLQLFEEGLLDLALGEPDELKFEEK